VTGSEPTTGADRIFDGAGTERAWQHGRRPARGAWGAPGKVGGRGRAAGQVPPPAGSSHPA
jgi:hypothetical protein